MPARFARERPDFYRMFQAKQTRNFACMVCKRKVGLLKAVEGQTAKKTSPARFARKRSDFYRMLKAKKPRNFNFKVCKRKVGHSKDVEGQIAKKPCQQGLQEKGRAFKGC